MRGAAALRPHRLIFTSARVGEPLSCPSPSRSLRLLYQHGHSTARSPAPRNIPHEQRRGLTSSPSRFYPDKSAAEETRTSDSKIGESSGMIAPDITNHYTLFPNTLPQGPPPQSTFEIDVVALRREFLQLQGASHPDKFPAGALKQRAEALSSRLNAAYRTLLDPLSRAQYLLAELHGIDVLAEDGASKYAGALDSETLMEIMDVQETVEELSSAPAAEAEETVDRLRGENADRVEASVQKLRDAFDSGDLETAEMETVRLRFWYSLRDGLREWEPGHGEIRIVH